MFCEDGLCAEFLATWSHLVEALLTPGILLPWGLVLSLFPALLVYLPYRGLLDTRAGFAKSYVHARAGVDHGGAGRGPRTVSVESLRGLLQDEALQSRRKWGVTAAVILSCCLAGFAALQVGEFQRVEGPTRHAGHLPLFDQDWVHGAAIGFLGAYFNLLVTLGRRLATRDPSISVLVAQSRTLITGAFLAALLPVLPGLELGDDAGTLGCFLLGAAPSLADGYVTGLARRVFGDTRAPTALRPLEHLSGMTLADADRLAEEGITDAQHLCNANPMALYLRVPFTLRQMLDWIDEALLYRYLTREAFDLRAKAGVTGGIDYVRAWTSRTGGGDAELARWNKLIEQLELDSVTAERLGELMLEDAQLNLVWRLYNTVHAQVDASEEPPGGGA